MEWTQEDIDKLKAAIVTGAKIVRFDGPPRREVEFQSLKEMRDLLAEMKGSLNPRPRRSLIVTQKGWR